MLSYHRVVFVCAYFFFSLVRCSIQLIHNRLHGITTHQIADTKMNCAKLIRKTHKQIKSEVKKTKLIETKSIELLEEWCHLGVSKI